MLAPDRLFFHFFLLLIMILAADAAARRNEASSGHKEKSSLILFFFKPDTLIHPLACAIYQALLFIGIDAAYKPPRLIPAERPSLSSTPHDPSG